MNVLLTCAGRRSYSVDAFKKAIGGRGKVYACDSNSGAPALQRADAYFIVPPADSPAYLDTLLRICREYRIELLVPALEPELPGLALRRACFLGVGTLPLVSSPSVINTCYDKVATAGFLSECGVSVPQSFLSLEAARSAIGSAQAHLPMIIKPRWGVSSIGTSLVEDDEELELTYRLTAKHLKRSILADISATDPKHCILIQECLEGHEFGLDIINDLNGAYVCTFAKRKLRMWAGQTDRAITVKDTALENLGRLLGERLGHIGLLDCDVFVGERGCYVIDINPRIGGGYPFSHIAGANFPAALMAWVHQEKPDPEWFKVRPGVAASRSDFYLTTPAL